MIPRQLGVAIKVRQLGNRGFNLQIVRAASSADFLNQPEPELRLGIARKSRPAQPLLGFGTLNLTP